MKKHNRNTIILKKMLLCCITAILIWLGLIPAGDIQDPIPSGNDTQISLYNENPCPTNTGRD